MSSDPFALLGVAPDADDTAIRAAYHALVRAGRADPVVNTAYAAIRDASARAERRWREPMAYLAALPVAAAGPPCDVSALASELAFLSDWELGEPDAS
jgi:hypothetical protein